MSTLHPLEKTIVQQIVRALKAEGVSWCIKTHGGPFQASGIPDILAIAPTTGRFLGIEVKRPKIAYVAMIALNTTRPIFTPRLQGAMINDMIDYVHLCPRSAGASLMIIAHGGIAKERQSDIINIGICKKMRYSLEYMHVLISV